MILGTLNSTAQVGVAQETLGHADAAHAVAFSPNGRALATAGSARKRGGDSTAGPFDVTPDSGGLFQPFDGKSVNVVSFSQESGDQLLTGVLPLCLTPEAYVKTPSRFQSQPSEASPGAMLTAYREGRSPARAGHCGSHDFHAIKLHVPARSFRQSLFLSSRESVWTTTSPYFTVIRVRRNGIISDQEPQSASCPR